MAVVHFVSDSMCDKMKKVDYVPERAGELEWGIVEAHNYGITLKTWRAIITLSNYTAKIEMPFGDRTMRRP